MCSQQCENSISAPFLHVGDCKYGEICFGNSKSAPDKHSAFQLPHVCCKNRVTSSENTCMVSAVLLKAVRWKKNA